MLLPSELPIVQAPMAGGASTPELAAAVASAGGFGFVAGGYLSPGKFREAIAATRGLTHAQFGVNLFVPSGPGDAEAVRAYADELRPEAERLSVPLGDPRWDDDGFDEKLAVVLDERPYCMTFTFGCPDEDVVEQLHDAGVEVGVTITTSAEAALAEQSGADFLVAQGTEAGGHQGGFVADAGELAPNERPLLDLLAELRDTTTLAVIAAGGLATGADVAAVLAAGAEAAQIGTALLCTPEAGTSAVHRAALLEQRFADTVITRAFSGRHARGLANRWAREHTATAPQAYPEIHHLTRPLRVAASKAGDADVPNLWAGTGWRAVAADPAGQVVRRIAAWLR